MSFIKILKKVPYPYYELASSRTSIWRRQNKKTKPKKLYYGLGLAFNIDGSNSNFKKEKYKKTIESIKQHLLNQDIEFLYKWIQKNFTKISEKISPEEVNNKSKLFLHLIYILPYVKENFKGGNLEGFISKILYNCTKSWYTNWCKKLGREKRLKNE